MFNIGQISKIYTCLIGFFVVFCLSVNYTLAFAQEVKVYNFYLPKVQVAGVLKNTTKISNDEYSFQESLGPNDLLRFGWENIDIDLNAKGNQDLINTGYFKAYYNEVKESNFLTDFGSSPLKLDKLATSPFIKEGSNTVLFELIKNNKSTNQVIKFVFNYTTRSNDPVVKIIKPAPFTLFETDKIVDFELSLQNFTIKTGVNLTNFGRLKVYINSQTEANFITNITESTSTVQGSVVKFNTGSLPDKFKNLADQKDAKIIFVLETNDNKTKTEATVDLPITLNYQKTLEIKSPTVRFNKISSGDYVFGRDEKIKFTVENFKLLNFDVRNEEKPSEGYLQILVNDIPHKLTFTDNEFTINQILPSTSEEKLDLRLQLVTANFNKLDKDASDQITIFIRSKEQNTIKVTEISNLRFFIIGFTILLLLGSIAYVVFRT
jgi:hypothetical protein